MKDEDKTKAQLKDELVQMRQRIAELEKVETERRRVEEEIARHIRRVEALHVIAQTVSQSLNLDELLDSALEKVLEVMGLELGAVIVAVPSRRMAVKAHRGFSQDTIAFLETMELKPEEMARAVAWERSTWQWDKLLTEEHLACMMGLMAGEGVQSYVAMPLSVKGVVRGALAVASRADREFSSEDLDLLDAIASQIAVGIDNANLFAEISRSATVDALTGLYNHRYFQERLEEEVARFHRLGGEWSPIMLDLHYFKIYNDLFGLEEEVAPVHRLGEEWSLIMLDLDYFKIYNDLFGHVAGDEVLKRVGQVLRDYTRQVDMACRYGGDEFAAILPQTGPSDAYQVAERLRKAVQAALSLESETARTPMTISLGVASFPSDGLSREELIRGADLALREAKERGRNQTCLASELPTAAQVSGVSWEVAEHLESASLNTIYALAAAVDARDHYTYGHSRKVSRYAVAMGEAVRLSKRRIEQLRIAALLHDIGKIGLSDSIIRKPGPLDEEEWEMMRKHSELGATIASHAPELADSAPAIRYHHEWWDGRGYPDGLKGEAIPLEARIIAIADAYDTMTTLRLYRDVVSQEEALEELRRCSGTQFDPELVEAFCRAMNKATRKD